MNDPQENAWWFCLRHNRAELGAGCPNSQRLGPYEDQTTAENALSIAADRNKEWEEQEEGGEQDR